MTNWEAVLIEAWSAFADAEIEHDQAAATRAWVRVQELQQREGEERR